MNVDFMIRKLYMKRIYFNFMSKSSVDRLTFINEFLLSKLFLQEEIYICRNIIDSDFNKLIGYRYLLYKTKFN